MEEFNPRAGGTCWFPFKKAYTKRRRKEEETDDNYETPPGVYYIQKKGVFGKSVQCEVALYEYDGETTSQFMGETELILEGHPMPDWHNNNNNNNNRSVDPPPSTIATKTKVKSRIQQQQQHQQQTCSIPDDYRDRIEALPRALAAIEINPLTKKFWTDETLCSDRSNNSRPKDPGPRWKCFGSQSSSAPPGTAGGVLRVNSLTHNGYESKGLRSEEQKLVWRSRVNSLTNDAYNQSKTTEQGEGKEHWFDDAISTDMVILREVSDDDGDEEEDNQEEEPSNSSDYMNGQQRNGTEQKSQNCRTKEEDIDDAAVEEIRRSLAEAGRDVSQFKRQAYEDKKSPPAALSTTNDLVASSSNSGTGGNFFEYIASASFGMYSSNDAAALAAESEQAIVPINGLGGLVELDAEALPFFQCGTEGSHSEDGAITKHVRQEHGTSAHHGNENLPLREDENHPETNIPPEKPASRAFSPLGFWKPPLTTRASSDPPPDDGDQFAFSIEVEDRPFDRRPAQYDHDPSSSTPNAQGYSSEQSDGPAVGSVQHSDSVFMDSEPGDVPFLARESAYLDQDEENADGNLDENGYYPYERTLESDPHSPSSSPSRHISRQMEKVVKRVRSFGSPFSGSGNGSNGSPRRNDGNLPEGNGPGVFGLNRGRSRISSSSRINRSQSEDLDLAYSGSAVSTSRPDVESPVYGGVKLYGPQATRSEISLGRSQSATGYPGRLRSGIEPNIPGVPPALQKKFSDLTPISTHPDHEGRLATRSSSFSSSSSMEHRGIRSESQNIVTPTTPQPPTGKFSYIYDEHSISSSENGTNSPPSVILSPVRKREQKNAKNAVSRREEPRGSRREEAKHFYEEAIRKQEFDDEEDSIFSDLDGSKYEDDVTSAFTATSKSSLGLSQFSATEMTTFTEANQDGPFAWIDQWMVD